jgi:hypothetical protein
MSRESQDSTWDMERFKERTRHIARESSPDAQVREKGHTETDFAALGAAFWDRRESLPRPNSLDISEGEETVRYSSQMRRRNEILLAVGIVGADRLPVRSATTPSRPHIQPSDMTQRQGHKKSKVQRRRRREHGR